MKTRDERIRYVIRHKDGYFIDVAGNQTFDFMKVTKWSDEESLYDFLNHNSYAPPSTKDYSAQQVRITYELMEDDASEHISKIN
ncbi:hypothetical protein MHH28_07900 [Paenibacillus sp. FSL K6-1217]|uniref:hypothetical protein n=1 Tax=Paenibacillus sp. FSL K6-1217 TaxID=2921466 RepID=UPI00324E377E